MFIYKITVLPINKVYIGFDTQPTYRKHRWKNHCAESLKPKPRRKIYRAMQKYGIENCLYEVVEEGFTSIGSLALAEINYIKQLNSYNDGLNSSPGGDGLGSGNLAKMTEEEIRLLREALGENFKNCNRKKWLDTTLEERREMLKNAHSAESLAKRIDTLKDYYASVPGAKEAKGISIKEWQKNNPEKLKEQNRISGLKGAAVVSKSIKVEFPNGDIVVYKSKMEMKRQTKQWPEILIRKTDEGTSHNGYKAWNIDE